MKIQLDWPQYFIEPRVEAELIRNAGTRFKASSLARFDFVNLELVVTLPVDRRDKPISKRFPSQKEVDNQLEEMIEWAEEPLKIVKKYLKNRAMLDSLEKLQITLERDPLSLIHI